MEDAEKTEQVNQEQQEVPLQNLVGLLSHFASRRGVMGALVGAMAGSAPFLLARPAQAAPVDLKGSPNLAVKMYQNMVGTFTLCSDGRIWNLDTGAEACSGLGQYTAVAASKFKTVAPVQGRIKGSPNIAVDAFVDKTGTYVLFADGSVRRPNGAAGKEGGSGNIRVEYSLSIAGGPVSKTDGWSGPPTGGVIWEPAFSVAPVMFVIVGNGVGLGVPVLSAATTNGGNINPPSGIGSPSVGFIAIGIG